METNMDIQRRPWGKYDSRTMHRLEHHCADVAACFEALVGEPVLRQRFDVAAGGRGLDDITVARLTVLAFLHDFGKVSTGFQFKVGDRPPAVPSHQGHLKPFFWACNRPEVIEGVGLYELSAWGDGLSPLLRAALAHHGRPLSGYSIDNEGPANIWQPFMGYDPISAGRGLCQQAREWFPVAFGQGPELPTNPALAHLFAGVVAIADQIGSNEELFGYVPDFDPAYIDRARDLAAEAVRKLGFSRSRWRCPTDRADFQALFGDWSPRPLQTAVAEAPLDRPLLILESETGSGKTEAAVWRFAKLWKEGVVDGLYFALPTRAAAKQLHERVSKALQRIFPSEAHLGTVLAVPGYIRVGDAAGRRAAGWAVSWADDPDREDRLARWSAESARKFLSATAAVGTVDQALLSGLKVKWAHFRGASLARSLLVVDEVHASDAYMTKVLKAVLRGHLEVGGHALLMSATLGSVARDALLARSKTRRSRNEIGKTEAMDVPYPVLAVSDASGSSDLRPFESTGYKKAVSMTAEPVMSDPARIGEAAIREARKGAKVLVIRNTIQAAMAVFEEACEQGAADMLLSVAGGPAVHHSRFAVEDRKLLDAAVEEVLGKGRGAGGRIVVGTQTLEQSLDIDADILITDLCPADVLLQRIGRLHRHESRTRPEEFAEPQCRVVVPEGGLDPAGMPKYGLGMSKRGGVYEDVRVLELTRRLVRYHPVWAIPEMNRMLVEESTHSELLEALEVELGPDWVARSQDVEGKAAAARQEARRNLLYRHEGFENATFPCEDERIRTRLGEDGPRIRLAESVTGPFGVAVTTFNLPAHLFRGQERAPSRQEIEDARADPVEDGLVLKVGSYRFRYNRGGVQLGG